MLKNLLISLVFVISLSIADFFNTYVLADNIIAQNTQTGDMGSEDFIFDVGVITHEGIKEEGTDAEWVKGGVNYVFGRIISVIATTIGSAAILVMVFGGFLMLSSGGNQDSYDKGKDYIKKAVVGLVITLAAYIIVTTVQLFVKEVFK